MSLNTKTSESDMAEGEVRTRVRYGETDQMGVVYHANYLLYFEMGRTEYMRERGYAYSDLERRGIYLAVVEAACRYRASAQYDDRIIIRTTVEKITNVTVTFHYSVHKEEGDVLLAEGTTTLACVSGAGKPQRLPREVAQALAG